MQYIFVDCEVFNFVVCSACDPHCDEKGCDKEGPGKCDKYCMSGYWRTEDHECVGKSKFCVLARPFCPACCRDSVCILHLFSANKHGWMDGLQCRNWDRN